jgi:hypothetical protein
LAAWYIIIGFRYYFHDLQALLTGRRRSGFKESEKGFAPNDDLSISNTESSDLNGNNTLNEEETEELFEIVEDLIKRLKGAIADVSSKNYNKQECIFLLQLTLKDYPMLKGSPFQGAINNLIISECEKFGSLHLSAEELAMLWKEVA